MAKYKRNCRIILLLEIFFQIFVDIDLLYIGIDSSGILLVHWIFSIFVGALAYGLFEKKRRWLWLWMVYNVIDIFALGILCAAIFMFEKYSKSSELAFKLLLTSKVVSIALLKIFFIPAVFHHIRELRAEEEAARVTIENRE